MLIFTSLKVPSLTPNSPQEVPQYLLESGISGKCTIAVTQPRRVAATSLATRVAAEQNVRLGGVVGYTVRFDDVSSVETRIKYVTDGMLVRELLSDALLSKYSVIVVDEAHERTLRTDILIANLKMIQMKRNAASDEVKGKGKASASNLNPLKIVVMSATLDAEKFSKFYHKYVNTAFSLHLNSNLTAIEQREDRLFERTPASRQNLPHGSQSNRLCRRRTTQFLPDTYRRTSRGRPDISPRFVLLS